MLSIPVNELTKSSNSVQSMTAIMHNSIPVITTELLAGMYGTDVVRIRQNHARNTDRFYEGKHFFIIKGKELQEFKNRVSLSYSVANSEVVGKRARSLTLWTERGAARHAKMLDTDQAWNVFEALEDFYFNQKEAEPVVAKTTVQQRNPLKNAINLLVSKKGIMYPEAYSLVHQRFNVEHIDELTADQLPQAIEYVHKMALEGEYLGKEELSVSEVKQISDDDLQILCWLWKYSIDMAHYMIDVEPLLSIAGHRLAGAYAELPNRAIRKSNEARRILEKATEHIQIKTVQMDNWRILHSLRIPSCPL
ncbi:ORF6N domain-containing protein [Xenorhabdus bovienii]|uniref:ORF6N domain-containing protein n=1 Tax=Xenorhabdus bovienii TaxID=40576 RepID=UPI002157A2C2|nr:ORF6N domain-containing protein [Xenorhabdus bovienii]